MFFMHTTARQVWPFLKSARQMMLKQRHRMSSGGFTLEDKSAGVRIVFEPRAGHEDRLRITVWDFRRGREDSYTFGRSRDAKYHDEPYRSDRGRWPLPWLMHGPMREMHDMALRSEYAFS